MRDRSLLLLVALAALACGLFSAVPAAAERMATDLDGRAHTLNYRKSVPAQLSYQGFLVNSSDSSAIDATLEMTFRLFDSETKGAELWAEVHPAVQVHGGLFQVLLGSITPFPDGLFDGSELWLQTEVESEILSPRKPMASVAYSHRTNSAEMLLDNTLTDLDDRWVNEADLDHLVAADGDPADAVYVDDDGKVGIGTASPLTELDVNGSVNAATYYGDGSNLTGISGTTDADWTIRGDTVYHETGPVGIGTSDPEMLLDVSGGTTRLAGGLIVGPAGYGVPGIHIYDRDTGPRLRFTNDTGLDSRCAISFADTSGLLWTIDNDIYVNGGQNFGIQDGRALEYRVFIDSTGQVGIGTITPSRTLDVAGDVNAATYYGDGSNLTGISGTTDNDWTISGSNIYHEVGNVGIGTNAPQRQLHITGANPRILIEASSSSPEVNFMNTGDAGTDIWSVYKHGTTDDLRFYQGGDKMTIQNSTGNVGIGTAAPAEKLHVVGNLRSSGTIQSGSSITIDGLNDRVTSSTDLELHVNSGRALRLESHATSPNLIGGYSGNSVTPGVYGATIGGGGSSGSINSVTGDYSTVAGGYGNTASSDRAFIGGGQDNTASSSFTTVGGGWLNQASMSYATVCGGQSNQATGSESFVGGGSGNTASGFEAFVGGGSGNTAGSSGFVGGGSGNTVSAEAGIISGGVDNRVTDHYGTVGGGYLNLAGDDAGTTNDAGYATVGGGADNRASDTYATIGGGWSNRASSYSATIGGGGNHIANANYATIAGGDYNNAGGHASTVGGGVLNFSVGKGSTIGGGEDNFASGEYAIIPGGRSNAAAGKYSFAAGRRAKANHHGSFVWADTTDADFVSNKDNEFAVRARDGMRVYGISSYYGAYINNQTGSGDGLRAYANVSNGNNWGALYAVNYGSSPAIYATATTAGYFSGNVTVTGVMSKGGGSFKIDHPLDPENKYLYHSFVESPDMMNIYNGNVILDARGQAWVELPEWFGPLNRDFRYQLTAVGAPGPNLYVAEKISGNRFQIAGGEPGMEVSWQVTGIRQDAFAEAHRIPVEEDKPENERGNYLHPREHGMAETAGIDYQARLRKESK